jgi:hypothetical protein
MRCRNDQQTNIRQPVIAAALALLAAFAHAAEPVQPLPLKRGFYVASDTPCAQASNATLLLLRRNGIGAARDFCEFLRIEPVGATRFRVTESCADFQSSDSETRTVIYDIPNDTRFESTSDDGWRHGARFCAQSTLPPDWRDNDIRDLIE